MIRRQLQTSESRSRGIPSIREKRSEDETHSSRSTSKRNGQPNCRITLVTPREVARRSKAYRYETRRSIRTRLRCVLTCNGPARRIREVHNPGRSSAASNQLRSSAPHKRRPRTRGRTCRDRNSPAGTGTPADRPDCTARLASPLCSNTCRRHRRRGRCSSDRNSRLQIGREED